MDPISATPSQPVLPEKSAAGETPAETASAERNPDDYTVAFEELTPQQQRMWNDVKQRLEAADRALGRKPSPFKGYNSAGLVSYSLTDDGKIRVRKLPPPKPVSPEESARWRAEAERAKKEHEALAAVQKEWFAKWGEGQPVSQDLKGPQLKAAETVGLAESLLQSVRSSLSTLQGLRYEVRPEAVDDVRRRAGGGEAGDAAVAAQFAKNDAAVAKELKTIDALVQAFRDNGYTLDGSVVENLGGGRYREGAYTLTKQTEGWAVRINSDEGITVSIGGKPFTRDFTRVVPARTGPALILQRMDMAEVLNRANSLNIVA